MLIEVQFVENIVFHPKASIQNSCHENNQRNGYLFAFNAPDLIFSHKVSGHTHNQNHKQNKEIAGPQGSTSVRVIRVAENQERPVPKIQRVTNFAQEYEWRAGKNLLVDERVF